MTSTEDDKESRGRLPGPAVDRKPAGTTSPKDQEQAELERALVSLAADSPARKPLLEALKALDAQEVAEPKGGTEASVLDFVTPRNALFVFAVVLVIAAAAFFSQTALVPSVVDEERSFAAGALRSAGFDINVRTRADGDVREGHVLEQSPAGGSRVMKGSAVTLVVSELPTFALEGTFMLVDSESVLGGDGFCIGIGGYSDIKSGLSVTVKDGAGLILATGSLENSRRSGNSCSYSFRIRDIKQADFYSVEVGRRGSLTFSHSEMLSNNWNVAFTLG